jgi:hypothetical protein
MFDEVAKDLHETAVEKGFWGIAYNNEDRESLDIFMTNIINILSCVLINQ